MSLLDLHQKIDLIESLLPKAVGEELLKHIVHAVERDGTAGAPRHELSEVIAILATYAQVRHLPWIDTPLFNEVFTDFLVTGMGISSSIAKDIGDILQSALSAFKPRLFPDIEADSDRHFLRYVFIASATASNEANLVADLGLGKGILRRIKSAANWIVSQSSPQKTDGAPKFMAALDACFAETMLEFSREMRQTPWIVDWYRAKYHMLIHTPSPCRPLLEALGDEAIFNFLVWAADRHAVNERFDLDEVTGYIKSSTIPTIVPTLTSDDFLALLCGAGLVEISHERTFKPKWRLTAQGEEFSSEAWVFQKNDIHARSLASIATLPHRLQAAFFKSLPLRRVEELHRELEQGLGLSLAPSGLEHAVRKVSLQLPESSLERLAKSLFDAPLPAFARRGLVQGFQEVMYQNAIRQLLKNIAESDSSPMVRDAARTLLIPAETGPSSNRQGTTKDANPGCDSEQH